ncbi:protein-export membrane protein SecF/protein-export membrane protein SecD [Eggerthella sp. CAG:1427]|nr:protein-export membrane protein SecF/protein-export membrane protein SecD [Eggerthella sp. CAG:1427]
MWLLIVTTLLVIASVFMFMPPQDKINQGLDIQGGLSVVLTAQGTDGHEVTQEDMEKSRAIIESRVNALGASEATVQVQGTDQILVQIPGLSDTETALETIGKTGKLEFARADSFTDEADQTAIANGTYVQQGVITDDMGNQFPSDEMQYLSVSGSYTPLITGENITRVTVDKESETSNYYAVNLTLDNEGTEAFAQATRELAPTNGQIVIVLDGQIQSAPAVQSEITGGQVAITGGYSLEEAQSLQTVLESGSLPVSFHYEQSQVVGPTLGQDALMSGLLVAILGLTLVILYLICFYRGLGLLTAAAMVVFAIFYLGLLATLSAFGLFSLSLAGIAGIVLTIGMAADSSILVLERFREEIRMGRSVRAASITGVRHGIETSIDADLVTLVSALTLFFLASASVKGFGMTLALGIMCDIVMMLLLKAPLIRLLAPKVIARHPGFWGIKDCEEAAPVYAELTETTLAPDEVLRPDKALGKGAKGAANAAANATAATDQPSTDILKSYTHKTLDQLKGRFLRRDINFMGVRKILLSLSAALIVLSVAVVGIKGVQFGIEFVGGTSIAFHNTGDISIEDMRAACADAGEPEAVVQTTNADGSAGFLVRTTNTSPEDAATTANQIASDLGISTDSFEVNTVGPDWGAGVIQSSAIAFAVSLLLIIAYIAIRFEYKMGIMAVVALLHDLIIVVGIYALVGREITPNMVAALLTILGYSLYDTVVVFHRINDNMKESSLKCTFMSMANHSINQVFIRTINTTLTSFVPVFGMLLFGGETLKDFAFAMAVGLIAGSYSSIAVATPLYAMWKSREPKNAKLIKKYGSDVQLFTFASTLPPASNEEAKAAVAAGEVAANKETVAANEAAKSASKASNSSAGNSASHNRKRRK